MEIFRLQKLSVREHAVFKNVDFSFDDAQDIFSYPAPYFTIIIGPNGTGKSFLLRYIIEIFRMAYEKQTFGIPQQYPKGKFMMEYFLDDAHYTISNRMGYADDQLPSIDDILEDKGLRFFRDGNDIPREQLRLPSSLLALSIMLTDKFFVLEKPENFPMYRYLGVRRNASTAGTRTYITNTINNILSASSNPGFFDQLEHMLKFLGLRKSLHISYSPKYRSQLFRGDLTEEFFVDFFTDYKKYLPKRNTEPWSVSVFRNLKKDSPELITKLVKFINLIFTKLEKDDTSRSTYFEFNLFNLDEETRELFPYLPHLQALNIISFPDITLEKESYYSIDLSSSGEAHFIFIIIGLVATITNHSLILIDEPEISLHPNWQMKYVDFLNKLFHQFSSVHFIISTHSHFLVSDLKPQNSAVISVNKTDSNIIKAEKLPFNTFGWSAEQVLLEVFKVPTTRNYFIADKIGDILEMVGREDRNDQEIKIKVKELIDTNVLDLSEEDPLKPVFDRLVEKYG